MKKHLAFLICINLFYPINSIAANVSPAVTIIDPNSLKSSDVGTGEKKALYREIFTMGYEKITNQVSQQKLEKNRWGVIFSLDGVLLDQSPWHLGVPGAAEITCKIQGMNGRVIIITDRSSETMPNVDYIGITSRSLSAQGICFDSIIFANSSKDIDKNPRFTAVTTSDYENVITTKRFPPINVVAYFGNHMLDFPNMKENIADRQPITDPLFSGFGQKYFILPR